MKEQFAKSAELEAEIKKNLGDWDMSDWQTVTLEDVTESINTGLDAIRRAPIVEHKTNLRCLRIQDISQNKPFDKWGYTEVKDSDFKNFS